MHQELLIELEPREHISPFQVNLFTDCAARYYETYRQHTSVGGKSVPLEFGDLIHLVIERASKLSFINITDEDKRGRVYECLSEGDVLKILDDFIINYPKLVTPGNLSRARYQLSYWYKLEQQREAKICMIDTGKGKIEGVEIGFEKYLPNGVLIKGFVDRIETNRYTRSNEAVVIDWKTGFLSDDYSYNMMIYVIACSGFDPQIKFIPYIYQLENEYFKKYAFSQEDYKLFFDFIERIKLAIIGFAQKIKSFKDEKELEAFLNSNAKLNKWCYTCRRKHKCIPYVTNILSGIPGISSVDRDPNLLVEYMDQLKLVEKTAKKEIGQVENILVDIIASRRQSLVDSSETHNDEDLNKIELEDGRFIELTRSKRRSLEMSRVISRLIELKQTDKLSITLSDFDMIVETLPGYEQDELRKLVFDSYSDKETPTVKGRKVKKK
jgi:hypothetical protein